MHGLKKSFLLFLGLMICAELTLRLTLPADFVGNFEYGFSETQGFSEDGSGRVNLTVSDARTFHPQSFSKERPAGRLRIVALGDSVEYWSGPGMHVLADTYPERLAAELRARGVDCESINLAVTGYGSMKQQVLVRKILAYQPDLILLKLNTINESTDESGFGRAEEYRAWSSKNWLRKSYLIQSLLILKENRLMASLLSNGILRTAQMPGRAAARSSSPDVSKDARFVRTIRETVRLAREQQVPVILVCQSFFKNGADGRLTISDNGLDALAANLKEPEVEVFSFTEALKDLPLEKVAADHVHLRPFGQEQIAHALSEKILRTRRPDRQASR